MAISELELERLSEEFLSIPMGTVRSMNVCGMFVKVDGKRFPPSVNVDGKDIELESVLNKISDPKDFLRFLVALKEGEF